MTEAAPVAGAKAPPFPRLRDDLAVDVIEESGKPFATIVVTDPVRGSYFKLAWPECAVFLAWRQSKSMPELTVNLQRTFGLAQSPPEIEAVIEFGLANQLTKADREGGWHSYAQIRDRGKHGILGTIMHGYLFFRYPLVRPEPWLKRMLPWLAFVFRRSFWLGIGLALALGLYLAAHDWSSVVEAAGRAFELQSMALYGAALIGLKLCHELGHALTTVRYGCRVPSMGIAVMLGTPIFYTDTSDSWRLARRGERLWIVLAGVAAEAIVASIAILAWSFLEAGFLREACFALATTALVTSVMVNLNPCMRFDGYFALSDILDIANLQPRAFALGRWKLRERLFGLGKEPPEHLPRRMESILIRYAAITAIYRFFLFMGIAAIVYAVAGKTVGIFLAGFEIGYFIVKPILQELKAWWDLRAEIVVHRRSCVTAALAALALLGLVLPWQRSVEAPGMRTAAREEAIYLPFPSRLTGIEVSEGDRVRAGDLLFTAVDESLQSKLKRAVLQWRLQKFRASRMGASSEESELRAAIQGEVARAAADVAAIRKQLVQLEVRAPFDGRIADLDTALSTGLWLNDRAPLAYVVSEGQSVVRGMVSDQDLARIAPGASAVFIPDDAAQAATNLRLDVIAPASDGSFVEPALANLNGGPIVANEVDGKLVAQDGMFEVSFATLAEPTPHIVRGLVRIEARPTSPIASIWRQIARVLVREQSF